MKLTTSVIATPDEIASALSDPEKRKQWDLNLQSIEAEGKNLCIVYSHSQSKYKISHTFLQNSSTYLVQELIQINSGLATNSRIFVVEELQNRPSLVSLTLYQEKLYSTEETRHLARNLNSLRNFV